MKDARHAAIGELVRFVGCLLGVIGASHCVAMAFAVGPPADLPVKWNLHTTDTGMVIGVSADHQLCVYELSGPDRYNWLRKPSVFPLMDRVEVDGTQVTPEWKYATADVDESDGVKLTIVFRCVNPAMELKSTWRAYDGPGPIRHRMYVVNKSRKVITIHRQESLDVSLSNPGRDPYVWYITDDGAVPDDVGVYHDKLREGYSKRLTVSEGEDYIPWLTVADGDTRGVYVGWEWSIGRLSITAHQVVEDARIRAGSGDQFKTDLSPGDTFEVPPAFVGAYQGDLDDAANSLHKYLFAHLVPAIIRDDDSYPKVEWNAFAATGQGQGSWTPTETKYYPLIDDIAKLGFEDVVIDVGWWNGDTTHQPHPPVGHTQFWPRGMLAASEYAHQHGMRFGLYWNCNSSMTTAEGMRHRCDDIKYLFDQFQVDFFRADGTDGNVLQIGDYGPGCRSHYAEDLGYWQTKGFYDVIDSLYATVPHFSYENCSGGGRLKDYGVMHRAIRIQDQDRYYPVDARRAFWDSSYAMHPMVIGQDRCQGSDRSGRPRRGRAGWAAAAPNPPPAVRTGLHEERPDRGNRHRSQRRGAGRGHALRRQYARVCEADFLPDPPC